MNSINLNLIFVSFIWIIYLCQSQPDLCSYITSPTKCVESQYPCVYNETTSECVTDCGPSCCECIGESVEYCSADPKCRGDTSYWADHYSIGNSGWYYNYDDLLSDHGRDCIVDCGEDCSECDNNSDACIEDPNCRMSEEEQGLCVVDCGVSCCDYNCLNITNGHCASDPKCKVDDDDEYCIVNCGEDCSACDRNTDGCLFDSNCKIADIDTAECVFDCGTDCSDCNGNEIGCDSDPNCVQFHNDMCSTTASPTASPIASPTASPIASSDGSSSSDEMVAAMNAELKEDEGLLDGQSQTEMVINLSAQTIMWICAIIVAYFVVMFVFCAWKSKKDNVRFIANENLPSTV